VAYSFGADAAGAGDLMRGATSGDSWQPVAECADRRCAMPALDSSGQKMAFVRTAQGARAGAVLHQPAPGMPASAAFGLDAPAMINPAWSHNGRYLAAYVPSLGELQVRDFVANEIIAVPAPSAEVFAWSGGEPSILAFATAQPAGESLVHRLWMADMQQGSVEPISELFMHPVTSMAWHPEHGSLAFSQRPNGSETTGRQLRVLDIRTRQTRDITQSSIWTYGGPAWSPDGSKIFVVRNTNRLPPGQPSIVVLNVATGDEQIVLTNATQPRIVRGAH
jgi:Tol biopolymer transport system component